MSAPTGPLLFVSHSPWLGGAERSLRDLVEALAGDHEVHVVLPRRGPLAEPLAHAGASVSVVPARWWACDAGSRPRWPDPRAVERIREILRARHPRIVVTNTMVHPPGALAAALQGVPHLWWIREFGERDHGFRFLLGPRGTLRAIDRLSRLVLVSSEAVRAECARTIRASRLRFVPHAVKMTAAGEPATDPVATPVRLVLVGRIRPSKGQEEAVQALGHLASEGIDAELDLLGAGTPGDVERVRGLAQRLHVAERVRFHGDVADPLTIVDRADVVLMCSREEAFGRATVEAMKRGRPVVGAASGGTLELIEPDRSGLLYPPGDARALAGAIARLLADDLLRARVARTGWETARARHTPERERAAFLACVAEATA